MPAGLEANIATVICRMVSNVPCLIVVDRHRRGGETDEDEQTGPFVCDGYNVLQPSIVALGEGEEREQTVRPRPAEGRR
jgi:hypothetical protein